jgi:2,5-furandicarboxylate decarboxylase 1
VQADRDVVVVPGARAKPLDPSLPVTPPGVVPVGAKVGIDATIPEGVPHERFERIAYAYADRAKIEEYIAGKADGVHTNATSDERTVARAASDILALIDKTPLYYSDIAEKLGEHPFHVIARALGKLHADEKLWQDPRGRLCVRGSLYAAKPPVSA